MRRSSIFLAAVTLTAVFLLMFFGITTFSLFEDGKPTGTNESANLLTPLETPTVQFGNPTRGSADAKVTIVEFGDYLCPPCADMEASLVRLLNEFPNDVRVVWKDLPNVALHDQALKAAVAARCAGYQKAFWEYHDLEFANQASINDPAYAIFAARLGLDEDLFEGCLERQESKPLVDRDFEEAQRLRLDATPYLFIGDRRISGAISYDQLRGLVVAAVAAAKQAAPKDGVR
jgi:protein-disulfide isomerase